MNILKEEEYIDQISQIIESDYFPDKKKLYLVSTLLDAQDSGNTAIVKAAESMLDSLNSSAHIALDSFLSKHTSEDNISFSQLQEENTKKFHEKHWWLNSVPKGLVTPIQPDLSKKEPLNSLMFMPEGITDDRVFKKPYKKICKDNTRLGEDHVRGLGFSMSEPCEKEVLALKLVEKNKSSAKSSRFSTPRTPSSRVSSIFPIFNYQIPSKRSRY